jgi:P4 family phage/plasmid primase-like protien
MEHKERLSALGFYTQKELDLIPLKKWNAVMNKDGKSLQVGKAPRDNNWRKKAYKNEDIKRAVTEGYNTGWRLGPEDLVLDVDPKNGGDKSLQRMQERFDIVFEDTAPTVVTGSGGRHFYFHKDPSIKIREVLDDENGEPYPGIEFKTNGRQVVTAGSRHPNGNWYEFDDFSPDERTLLRDDIFQLLIRPSRKDGAASAGKLSTYELAEYLEKLDPSDYQSQEEWLTIMMASHHATDGEGSDEFIEWSTSDPEYADHGNIIRMRWDSLHSSRGGEITYKTLLNEIKKAGHGIVINSEVKEAFGDDWQRGDDETLNAEEAEKQTAELTYEPSLMDLIFEFDPFKDKKEDLRHILMRLGNAEGIEKVRGTQMMQKKLQVTKSEMNQIIKDAKEKILDDLGEMAVRYILDNYYAGGKHLIYVNDSQFWAYNSRYWQPVDSAAVGAQVVDAAQDLRKELGVPFPTHTLSREIEYLIKRMVHADISVLRLDKEPLPVINCLNGELWIGEDGRVELVPHKYDSYLTNCLDVEFDPEATAPQWDDAIREIFSKTDDADATAEYFEEVMGYVMQPRKNIAAWWLLNGRGSNGKSLLADVMASLCGSAALAKPIRELNTDKNNHALSDLPGKLMVYDDDMDTNIVLPDGILKKISERKLLQANPKGKAMFSFISTATPVMLTNRLPTIKDPSNGTKRRAHVIPFERVFTEDEMDINLGEHIKTEELPGVLNRALAGLLRLRERGKFLPPADCKTATETFLNRSNTFLSFIADCVEKTGDDKDKVNRGEFYDAYLAWCSQSRVKYEVSRNSFYENCRQIGLKEKPGGQRRVNFVGVKLDASISDEFEDD